MFDIRKIQEKVLFDVIEECSNAELAQEIVFGKGNIQKNDSEWVKSTMSKLEDSFSDSQVENIRMNCQCGYGMDEKIDLLKLLILSSSNLKEFAEKDAAREAGLYLANDELYLEFDSCPCPILQGIDRLVNDTWCKCTIGYTKTLFEKAFNCDIQVELLKSVKMGDDVCLQKIDIKDFNWNIEKN